MLPNPGQDAVPFTTLTAQFYDETIENIESLADGSGIDTSAINSSKINFGGNGAGIWWEEVGRTTLTTVGDVISITGLPARKYIKIVYSLINSGVISGNLRFNGDAGSNYGWRKSINGAADIALAPTTQITADNGGNAYPIYGEINVINTAGNEKIVYGNLYPQAGAGPTTAPIRIELGGKWVNTSSAISSISFTNLDSGDYSIGSEVIVLGHN